MLRVNKTAVRQAQLILTYVRYEETNTTKVRVKELGQPWFECISLRLHTPSDPQASDQLAKSMLCQRYAAWCMLDSAAKVHIFRFANMQDIPEVNEWT